jgi:hypothetical protein
LEGKLEPQTLEDIVRKMFRAIVAASLVMAPAIAGAQDVKIDFDKAFNFSTVKTYSIKIGTTWGNDLSQRRVLAEIDEAIAGKGWKKADEATADVRVVLHGATDTKRDVNTFYSGMGGYGGYGYRGFGGAGMGMGSATTTVNEYKVGTLVVDIFDPKAKTLVFRGTAADEISDKADKNVKKLDKAATKLFKDFPPGSKTK